MSSLLVSLGIHMLWAGVAVYAVRTADCWWMDFWQRRERVAATGEVPEIPEDLMALALNEREGWAQEEVLRVIRESYERFGDWNAVRAGMGVAGREINT